MFKAITTLLISLALISCASTGVRVNPDDVSKLKNGVTTEAQVREIFGSPSSVSLTPEGEKLFAYNYYKSTSKAENFIPIIGGLIGGSDNETETLQIWIDTNGKVKNHLYNQSTNETKAGILAN